MSLFLRNLLFTLVVPGTVAVAVPLALVRDEMSTRWVIPASILLAVGTSIYLWCVLGFAIHGRGTPAPIDAPKRLVIRGLYRYSRNPMYVGVLTVIGGWSLLFADWRLAVYALAVATAFHLFVVSVEEPKLGELFGDQYFDYKARVPRWLFG